MKIKYWLIFISLFLSTLVFSQSATVPYDKFTTNTSKELEKIYHKSCINEKRPGDCLAMSNMFSKTSFKYKAYRYKACEYGFEEVCKSFDEDSFLEGCGAFIKSPNVCQKKFNKIELYTPSSLLFNGALVCIFLAVFIVAYSIFREEDEYKAQEIVGDSDKKKKEENLAVYGVVLKYSRPFFIRYISPVVAGMKDKKKIREKYRRKLSQGGLTDVLTTEDFYAFKLFLIIGFPVAYLGAREFMEVDWSLDYIPLISIFGFYYPDIWINGQIEKRQKEVLFNLPFAIDMLALGCAAGMDFIEAMGKVVEKARPSALTEEFDSVIKDIRIGSTKAEALRMMIWRSDLLQMASFGATLIAADSVGADIAPILKDLSVEMREKRSANIEKEAAAAQTKILIPLIFLVVPAVFLIIGAPLGIQFIQGGGQ